MLYFSPLEQFEIFFISHTEILFGIKLFITNYLLEMICISLFTVVFFLAASNFVNGFLIPNVYLFSLESLYNFIYSIILQQVGTKAKDYFPLLMTLFVSILVFNVFGLFPFGFTLTSHLMTTFTLSFMFFTGLTILGFERHGLKFLNLFVPKDVPVALVPFLVVIEFVSYLSRMFSLAIRLFANMTSGHALLFILTSFYVKGNIAFLNGSVSLFDFLPLIPLVLVILIFFLEVGIAFLQAYVFAVLVSIYLNDSFSEPGH
jgi:F-type H+-transporting ATPase subunit a